MNDPGAAPKKKSPPSSTGSSSSVPVPTPTSPTHSESEENANMDESGNAQQTTGLPPPPVSSMPPPPPPPAMFQPPPPPPAMTEKEGKIGSGAGKKGKAKAKAEKKKEKEKKKGKKSKKVESSEEESNSEESSNDNESSEDEKEVKKKKQKVAAKKKAASKLKVKQKERSKKKKKSKKSIKYESSDDSDSEDELESESESGSDDESESSEDEKAQKAKKSKAKAKAMSKKKKASKKDDSSSSDSSSSSSSSDSSSSEDEKTKRKMKKKKAKKRKAADDTPSSETEDSTTEPAHTESPVAEMAVSLGEIQQQYEAKLAAASQLKAQGDAIATMMAEAEAEKKMRTMKKRPKDPKHKEPEFKRVDQVWDAKGRDYVCKDTVEEKKDDSDSVFTVRRKFDMDDKYLETLVDIKSKLLRNALQVVFKNCKSISLVEDEPSIQPGMLYHFYKEIKTYVKETLKPKLKRATKKRKDTKTLARQIAQCELLLRYVDQDFSETRKTLKPMLKAGTITFDLVWALFKPNTIVWAPTFGNQDEPRAFRVDEYCQVETIYGKKKWEIEGRYLECDGKSFGMAGYETTIPEFKGHKKIANLANYPLKFHKEGKKLRKELLERGKKFIALQGMNYKFQKGLAYKYVRNSTMKYNINGRVMIDPALFRRINPNYPYCHVRRDDLNRDSDADDDSDDEEEDSDSDCDSDDNTPSNEAKPPKTQIVWWKDKSGKKHLIRIPVPDESAGIPSQKLEVIKSPKTDSFNHVFTEEELLIASPVVLGFSFSDKAWVEFSLSGISDIKWNDEAFDSLVLPDQIKQNLKGLVSSHRFDAAHTIDDVIVGKGKGLNVVLHGPPGVGKTLTGESIAEYLRCPLYAVSSGELGTSAGSLERDLNRIMDITHSWGAILLLDEADVFLEARESRDMHRNALVSVFLRLTEYYQGIMFLTTNRVSTFDEAFQSRIHMGIRYEDLSTKARKKIWQHHVGKVLAMRGEGEDHKCKTFEEEQFDELSKKVMNGRQIKNLVKTSQAIAVAEKGVFGMDYLKRVMEAYQVFEDDMRGGRGYRDAMRQYT